MHTVAVLSQKGGCGKTTLCTNIAVLSELSGYSTAIIDLDPQATAERWGEWRKDDPPAVISAKATTLSRRLDQARNAGAELVVIDTPPVGQSEAREAAALADLVLIPCRPSAFDLDSVRLTARLAIDSRKTAFVVINAAHPAALSSVTEAGAVVKDLGLQVCPVRLADRAAFRRAGGEGRGVVETEPDGKAAEEMRNLYSWIAGVLPLAAKRRRAA